MKLKVDPHPPEYTADKAVTLSDEKGTTILLGCPHASAVAREIAHRVNYYDPMLAVLEVFSPDEMGNLLVDAVGALEPDNPKAQEATLRLGKLINAVAVILKGIELRKELGGET